MNKTAKTVPALPASQAQVVKRPVGSKMSQLLSVEALSKVTGGGYPGPQANPRGRKL